MTSTLRQYSVAASLVFAAFVTSAQAQNTDLSARYIVQAETVHQARGWVERIGGTVESELSVIRAVGAVLSPAQAAQLRTDPPGLRVHANHPVKVSGLLGGLGGAVGGLVQNVELDDEEGLILWQPKECHLTTWVGADQLHDQGVTGQGVAIAVLDTGIWQHHGLELGINLRTPRIVARVNVLDNESGDPSGHGTHISTVAASSFQTPSGRYQGIAPDANLVDVKAFDENGASTYLDVIEGIEWVVNNRETYNIRVLNMSFSAPPQSFYWEDPLNQAVMAAWQAGITA